MQKIRRAPSELGLQTSILAHASSSHTPSQFPSGFHVVVRIDSSGGCSGFSPLSLPPFGVCIFLPSRLSKGNPVCKKISTIRLN